MSEKAIISFILGVIALWFVSCANDKPGYYEKTVEVLRDSVLLIAEENLNKEPVTVTASYSERSEGVLDEILSWRPMNC